MDQAESLRRRMSHSTQARMIAVASGKGGVGKSNLCVNAALSLVGFGYRTLILDLDSGMGNVDVIMGVKPNYHLVDMIQHRLTVWDVIETSPLGLSYIAGGSGLVSMVQFTGDDMSYLQQQLQGLTHQFDFIFLDMGAGVTEESLQLLASADDLFLITTPEPTALTDAYSLLKQLAKVPDQLQVFAVANQTDSEKEGIKTLNKQCHDAKQFLKLDLIKLGQVPFDRSVSKAVKAQIPYSAYQGRSKAGQATEKFVQTYLSIIEAEPKAIEKAPFFKRLGRWMSETAVARK